MAKVATGPAIGSITPVLRLGGIKGAVNGATLAKNLFNALIEILRSKLPIHIYIDHNIKDKIAAILDAMGINYIIIPVEEMKPPYIRILEDDGSIIVITRDEEKNLVTVAGASLSNFLDSFIGLFKKRYPEKSRKVLELIRMSFEEDVDAKGVVVELEDVEAEIGEESKENHTTSIEETLKDFETG